MKPQMPGIALENHMSGKFGRTACFQDEGAAAGCGNGQPVPYRIIVGYATTSAWGGTIFLLLLVLFRKLLRNHWLASVVFTVCILGVGGFASRSVADWGVLAFLIATEVILLTRYGLVALISFFFMFYVAMCLPLTTDVAAWYAGSGLFGLGVLGAMAAFAFYTSTLSGQSLFTELAAARK